MRYAGAYPASFWELRAADCCAVFLQAKERETEERLFFRWIVGGFHFEMSFDDFRMKLRPDHKSAEEIVAQVAEDYDRAFAKGYKQATL